MIRQKYILRFEKFIKSDSYWRKVYRRIAEKIKSCKDYRNFVKSEKRVLVEDVLRAFEFRLFSESRDIEKLSAMPEDQLFKLFRRFYEEAKVRRSLVPVNRVPPPEYVRGLLLEIGDTGYRDGF
ncbi:MAG: hypothetical protein JSV92_01490 [archaeon]|nr:MAG: hypothetical protein JSV92_01490 [archaeon]